MVLVETDLEGLVVDDAVDVGREVVQDLEWQVAEGLLGALDPLTGVRLGKRNAQEFTSRLQFAVFAGLGNVDFSSLGEGVEILDALLEVRVVNTRLESKSVLDGTRKRVKEVQRSPVR